MKSIIILLFFVLLVGCSSDNNNTPTGSSSSSVFDSENNPFSNVPKEHINLVADNSGSLVLYSLDISTKDSLFSDAISNSSAILPFKSSDIVAKLDDTIFVADTQISKIYTLDSNLMVSKSSLFNSKIIKDASSMQVFSTKGYILSKNQLIEFSPITNSPLFSFDLNFKGLDLFKIGEDLLITTNNRSKAYLFNTTNEMIVDSIEIDSNYISIVQNSDKSFYLTTKSGIILYDISSKNITNLSISSSKISGDIVVDSNLVFFTTGNDDAYSLSKYNGSVEMKLAIEQGKISKFFIVNDYLIIIAKDDIYNYVLKVYDKNSFTPAFNQYGVVADKILKVLQ